MWDQMTRKGPEATKEALIAAGVVVALVTWGGVNFHRDNNTFQKSRSHWEKCSAWVVRFRNPYAGNYTAPTPQAKARRKRRSAAEIKAEKVASEVALSIDGVRYQGQPEDIAAVIKAIAA